MEKRRAAIRERLVAIINLLNDNHICYWLDFGTLLGAIRDNDVILWDKDGDISIWQEDSGKVCALLPQLMYREPQLFNCTECWFDGAFKLRFYDIHIDIYPWIIDEPLCRHPQSCFAVPSFPLDDVNAFIDIPFIGTTARIPKKYDQRLRRLYGDWHIRVRDDGGYWEGGNRRIVNALGQILS